KYDIFRWFYIAVVIDPDGKALRSGGTSGKGQYTTRTGKVAIGGYLVVDSFNGCSTKGQGCGSGSSRCRSNRHLISVICVSPATILGACQVFRSRSGCLAEIDGCATGCKGQVAGIGETCAGR